MSEQQRIDFIVRRDGLPTALTFAERTKNSYRSAVLQSRRRGYEKPHHASLQDYRRTFIESYCYLKTFLSLYN